MKYLEEMQKLTEQEIPSAWETAVKYEHMAEILVYNLLIECMNNLEEVSVEIPEEDPIAKVLVNWAEDVNIDFGKNAIYIHPFSTNDTITLGCVYDLYKIREDLEMIEYDMFGTISDDDIKDIPDINSEISDEEMLAYTDAITTVAADKKHGR